MQNFSKVSKLCYKNKILRVIWILFNFTNTANVLYKFVVVLTTTGNPNISMHGRPCTV